MWKCTNALWKEFKPPILGINNFCLTLYIFRVEGILLETSGIDVEFYHNFVAFAFKKKNGALIVCSNLVGKTYYLYLI